MNAELAVGAASDDMGVMPSTKGAIDAQKRIAALWKLRDSLHRVTIDPDLDAGMRTRERKDRSKFRGRYVIVGIEDARCPKPNGEQHLAERNALKAIHLRKYGLQYCLGRVGLHRKQYEGVGERERSTQLSAFFLDCVDDVHIRWVVQGLGHSTKGC